MWRPLSKIYFFVKFLLLFYNLAIINFVLPIKLFKDHTDAELILLWRQGDNTAFAALYEKYVLQLLAIAMDKTRDRQVAEELVQDTFLSFYKSSISLDKLSTVMAFLYVILKNKILDWHRKNTLQRKFADYATTHFADADDSTRALIETRELEQLLQAEIEKLPEQCRKVFTLRRKNFLSNKEIALQMDISENTVEQHMRRALRLLRISFINHDVLLIIFLAHFVS